MTKSNFSAASLLLTASLPAFAYLGPGMSGGVVAAIIGVVGSIFLALFGVLYYPVKRALKNKRKQKQVPASKQDELTTKEEVEANSRDTGRPDKDSANG